jgi:hypothetical protein
MRIAPSNLFQRWIKLFYHVSSVSRWNRKAAKGAYPFDGPRMGQGMDQARTERISCLLLTPGESHIFFQVVIGEPAHHFINLRQQCIKCRNYAAAEAGCASLGGQLSRG